MVFYLSEYILSLTQCLFKYLKIFAELNKVYSSLNKVYFVLYNFRNMKVKNEANNLICHSSSHPTSIN